MLALLVIAVSSIHIARELNRFNNFIDAIRSEIPMSLLGN
jgi:hypothetical protein